MNYKDIQSIIVKTVDSLEGIGSENAIKFNFELRTDYYGNGFDYSQSRFYEVVVMRDSNYKSVFYRKSDHPLNLRKQEWVLTACDDSCWRRDGFRFLFGDNMEFREELKEQQMLGKRFENIYETNSNVNFRFGIGRFFHLINAKKENMGDYNYSLTILGDSL